MNDSSSKPRRGPLQVTGALASLVLLAACESTGGGSSGGSVSMYYGVGFNDPWYYGPGYPYYGPYPPPVVVVPPPPGNRPGDRPRPEPPIATVPPSRPTTKPATRPQPVSTRPASSSMSRPMPRGGGGRRR
jgi:hypothetical protein